jgi:plastocyanin
MALLAGLAIVALCGCELKDDGDNLVNGKDLFAANCASCHELARAGAKGTIGPSLDEAWQQAEKDGFGRSTYEGLVVRQIHQPNGKETDPYTGKEQALMPANLVTGEDAEDVAAYVAYAAARGGEDTGRLAQVKQEKPDAVAKAENGTLDIPADPTGLVAYEFGSAEAPAGPLTINSPNESSVDHNIAVEGGGVDEIGPVVKDGGTSTIEVDLRPGEYEFYCSVEGHREAGMAGKLTVE